MVFRKQFHLPLPCFLFIASLQHLKCLHRYYMFMTFYLVSWNLRLIGCFPWIVLSSMVVALDYDCTMAL